MFGLFALFFLPLEQDYSYQESFVLDVSGYITQGHLSFSEILVNNLTVAFFTFILSFLVFSAMVFVLVWNASIVSYYLFSLGSIKQSFLVGALLLSHGLLEIGGFMLAGIAGSLLAYRFDKRKKLTSSLNKQFYVDLGLLLGSSIFLIVFGAIIEVL